MRKVLFVVALVVLAASFALAQAPVGPTTYTPTFDVMGPHENGGRGCAGCHAPHSGGQGSGGNTTGTGAQNPYGAGASGNSILWGTDTTAIQTIAPSFYTGYSVPLNAAQGVYGGTLWKGVATCLSCHDGNVSRGAMMSGYAYEQTFGLLNFATVTNTVIVNGVITNGTGTTPNLYGGAAIPTLLGVAAAGGTAYENQHPVGPAANLGKVFGSFTGNLTITIASNKSTYTVTPGSAYANFVNSYGMPAVKSLATDYTVNTAGQEYIVCTTCHNQHVVNVYSATSHGAVPIANGAVTSARTIFFVNGPYNPGAPYGPQAVPSTMRFCTQCHFSMSSESYGLNLSTAY